MVIVEFWRVPNTTRAFNFPEDEVSGWVPVAPLSRSSSIG